MAWIGQVVLSIAIMISELIRGRREMKRGVKFEWPKALALAGGCIAVSVVALGGMFLFFYLNDPMIGGIFCLLALSVGLPAIMVGVTRRWPTNPARTPRSTGS